MEAKMLNEFKEFIAGGSVVDLAVGVVIGAAFAAVVGSLVDDLIMPPIGMLIGGIDFSNLGIILQDADKYGSVKEAIEAGAPVFRYGNFINAIIKFLIIGAAIFAVVKGYTKLVGEKEEEVEETPANEVLLAEIRDLLAKK